MNPRSVLFVGLGGAGQRHLRIFRSLLPEARFLAFRRTGATPFLNADFSVAPDKDPFAVHSVERVADLATGLAQKPDLVVVSTPSALHLEPVMAALRQGSGILVEKPWSADLAGFGAFRDLVERSGVPFRISFQRRFHPLLARARALVAEGALGRIVQARFEVGSYVPAWHPYEDWRGLYAVRPELGGGVLLTECHEFDLACWYFGLPEKVFCTGGNFGPEQLAVEDTAQVTLDFGGFSVQVALCFMQKEGRRSFEIAGTDGFMSWNAAGNRLSLHRYATGAVEEWADPTFAMDAMFERQARALVQDFSAQGNDEHLRAAWATQAVVEAARASMRSGRAVPLPAWFSEELP